MSGPALSSPLCSRHAAVWGWSLAPGTGSWSRRLQTRWGRNGARHASWPSQTQTAAWTPSRSMMAASSLPITRCRRGGSGWRSRCETTAQLSSSQRSFWKTRTWPWSFLPSARIQAAPPACPLRLTGRSTAILRSSNRRTASCTSPTPTRTTGGASIAAGGKTSCMWSSTRQGYELMPAYGSIECPMASKPHPARACPQPESSCWPQRTWAAG
mmetsp:Transcript_40541/g.96334  ORF Transcript_40541/g.96334 Transcript_40541/m.96334 type:complete len:213 (-) Transcript_40541:155-793(-)